jgi:hypothetical protein
MKQPHCWFGRKHMDHTCTVSTQSCEFSIRDSGLLYAHSFFSSDPQRYHYLSSCNAVLSSITKRNSWFIFRLFPTETFHHTSTIFPFFPSHRRALTTVLFIQHKNLPPSYVGDRIYKKKNLLILVVFSFKFKNKDADKSIDLIFSKETITIRERRC